MLLSTSANVNQDVQSTYLWSSRLPGPKSTQRGAKLERGFLYWVAKCLEGTRSRAIYSNNDVAFLRIA